MNEPNLQAKLSSILSKEKLQTHPFTDVQKYSLSSNSTKSLIRFGIFLLPVLLISSFFPLVVLFLVSIFVPPFDWQHFYMLIGICLIFLLITFMMYRDNSYSFSKLWRMRTDDDVRDNSDIEFTIDSSQYIQFIFPGKHFPKRYLIQLPQHQLLLVNSQAWIFRSTGSVFNGFKRVNSLGKSLTLTVAPHSGKLFEIQTSDEQLTPSRVFFVNGILVIHFPTELGKYFSYLPEVCIFPGTLATWKESMKIESDRMKKLIMDERKTDTEPFYKRYI